MKIFAYTESNNGKYRKTSFETISYAKSVAEANGGTVVALSNGVDDVSELGKYGADEVVKLSGDLEKASPEVIGEWIANNIDADVYVLPHSFDGSTIAPFISVTKDAALITNVIEAPSNYSPFTVSRTSFSGKGIMHTTTQADKKVLTISVNSFGLKENQTESQVSDMNFDGGEGKIQIQNVEKNTGKQDLKEAEKVVSAGRGLKGPENWGMIEELAEVLNAATACSKPVSDMDWRPHTEHVGQTGKAIAPDLYIAVGISGAIQHLAGVNSSKTIVVINNDKEAPFFASADYGIVGDAFEVVPKLVEALKSFNS